MTQTALRLLRSRRVHAATSVLGSHDRLIKGPQHHKVVAGSRNVFHVFGQHFIDERLVPQIAALRFLPKLVDHSRIETNCNQLTRLFADRRTSDASHRAKLLCGSLWNVREINLLCPRTPLFPSDSLAAR